MITTESLLRASLRARADRTEYEPTRLIQVAGRVRVLRRRRTGIALLATAAAVAAVAVPVGIVLGRDREQAPQPAPAPSTAVTADISSLDELAQGAAPGIDYVDDRTYVAADGSRTDLPVGDARLAAVAPYRGGFLVTAANPALPNAADVSWLDGTGTRWTRCGSDQLAVSEDSRVTGHATIVYGGGKGCETWVGTVLTWGLTDETRDLDEQVTSNGERVDPVAVTDQDMVYNVSDPTTGEPIRVDVTPLMGPPEQVPGLQSAADLDHASGTLVGTDTDGTVVLVDLGTGEVRAELGSSRTPVSFSPDGRYVVTASYEGDGRAPLTVHDAATGAEVLVVPAPEPGGTLPDPWAVAWEDDSHLLVGAMDTTEQAIVRIGLDGTVELATTPAPETLAGFLFADGS